MLLCRNVSLLLSAFAAVTEGLVLNYFTTTYTWALTITPKRNFKLFKIFFMRFGGI